VNFKLYPMSMFTTDSSFGVAVPEVTVQAMAKYKSAKMCEIFGPKSPESSDARKYYDFARYLAKSTIVWCYVLIFIYELYLFSLVNIYR